MIIHRDTPSLKQALLLALALGIYLFAFLDIRPLGVPSEARYAEIPREMAASGDWVTPRLNGVKYFEKPALFYWLQASALMVFGDNEWAVRFWPALLGVFGCVATYAAGAVLYGRKTGLLASAMLGTGPIYFALSRVALTDMAVSTFLVLCLFCFIAAVDRPEGRARRLLFYGAYASAALALLSKGLIGIVIPGAIVFLWLLITGRWSLLKRFYLPSGLAIFFLIAAPWHVLVGLRTPEFWWFYFIHEHFLRYSTMVSKRWEPVWFFIPIILLNFMFWPRAFLRAHADAFRQVWRAPRLHPRELFLLIAIVFQFVFFSSSHSKLVPYILPVFPFMALLVAEHVLRVPAEVEKHVRLAAGLTAFLAAAAIVGIFAPHWIPGFDAEDVAYVTGHLLWVGAFFALVTLLLLLTRKGNQPGMMLGAILAAAAGLGWWGDMIAAHTQFKSVKPLAAEIRARLKRGDVVLTYRQYNQDLPFYLGRTVTVFDWQGELEFGMSLEDTGGWMIDIDALRTLWDGKARVYAVVRDNFIPQFKEDLQIEPDVIARTPEYHLIVNH